MPFEQNRHVLPGSAVAHFGAGGGTTVPQYPGGVGAPKETVLSSCATCPVVIACAGVMITSGTFAIPSAAIFLPPWKSLAREFGEGGSANSF